MKRMSFSESHTCTTRLGDFLSSLRLFLCDPEARPGRSRGVCSKAKTRQFLKAVTFCDLQNRTISLSAYTNIPAEARPANEQYATAHVWVLCLTSKCRKLCS